MTTSRPPATTAAAIFVAAFKTVFEDDEWMTIGIRQETGTGMQIAGHLNGTRMDFAPADVDMLLSYLGRLLEHREHAVLTVTVPYRYRHTREWAWHLPGATALPVRQAAPRLGGPVEYTEVEPGHGLRPDKGSDPDSTAVTEQVQELLRARGLKQT